MHEPLHTAAKGGIGVIGAVATWLSPRMTLAAVDLSWLDPLLRITAKYGGTVVVILTVISISIDIYRKVKGLKGPK